MSKSEDQFTVFCPLGCGTDITDLQDEHVCRADVVDDPDHRHAFGTEGVCACSLTALEAVEMAAQASLDPRLPAASTACKECDAPITDLERKTSGTCADCLGDAAKQTARPARVALAPAESETEANALEGICPLCGLVTEDAETLEAHMLDQHVAPEGDPDLDAVLASAVARPTPPPEYADDEVDAIIERAKRAIAQPLPA